MREVFTKKIYIFILVICVLSFLGGCSIWEKSGLSSDLQTVVTENTESDDASEAGQESDEQPYEYAYDQLDDETRAVYREIVSTIESRAEKTELSTKDLAVMEKAYQAVRYDHCEYFWLKKFSYVTYSNRKDEITEIDFCPEYSVDENEQKDLQTKIDADADRMLEDAPFDGSDFDKVLYVYNTLIDEVDYDKSADNNQNLISTFITHRTVCQGYAYGAQYLLNRLGIPCTTIEGETEDGNHSWNLVMMDGAYYYIDLTWGNSQFMYYMNDEEDSKLSEKFIDYTFMGADSETILKTRTPSEGIPLPECTAQDDNYYIHEDLFIPEWDADLIGNKIKEAYDDKLGSIQIKFANEELYEQAMQYFLEDYHIMDYCFGMTKVQYVENSDHNVMFLVFDQDD
ncbi:MAG: hypothetical protein IJV59_04085 [Eubacterium sp.]|nr:hypothetical protein [Eubacterium sp.]MBQ9022403.1 hypothetical protein [Eubacterium sp.]